MRPLPGEQCSCSDFRFVFSTVFVCFMDVLKELPSGLNDNAQSLEWKLDAQRRSQNGFLATGFAPALRDPHCTLRSSVSPALLEDLILGCHQDEATFVCIAPSNNRSIQRAFGEKLLLGRRGIFFFVAVPWVATGTNWKDPALLIHPWHTPVVQCVADVRLTLWTQTGWKTSSFIYSLTLVLLSSPSLLKKSI